MCISKRQLLSPMLLFIVLQQRVPQIIKQGIFRLSAWCQFFRLTAVTKLLVATAGKIIQARNSCVGTSVTAFQRRVTDVTNVAQYFTAEILL